MGLLNAWMLPLLAVIGLPIIIHLLFRRRPKPLPWAAMRFLRLAQQRTQRRWRLDQWLLLFLRTLVLALFVVALARPIWGGATPGHLILFVDRSASMGERSDGPGALANAIDTLRLRPPSAEKYTILSVSGDEIIHEASGTWDAVHGRLEQLTATKLPGGLDSATPWPADAEWQQHLTPTSSALLLSDFRQDNGTSLAERLAASVADVTKWRVGTPGANAQITGVLPLADLLPQTPGTLNLATNGTVLGARLGFSEGSDVPVPTDANAELLRLPLPPLAAGEQRARVNLLDRGLIYDNALEIPLTIVDRVPVTVVTQQANQVQAALQAAAGRLAVRVQSPIAFTRGALPAGGLVVAAQDIDPRLTDWVADGGILWTTFEASQQLPTLLEISPWGNDGSGPLQADDAAIDTALAILSAEQAPQFDLPPDARVLLWAGETPVVFEIPKGKGAVVIDAINLEQWPAFWQNGACVYWYRQAIRTAAARLVQPKTLVVGHNAPRDLVVNRGGIEHTFAAGERLLLPPGLWYDAEQTPLLLTADPNEGDLSVVNTEISSDPPRQTSATADAGWPLLLLCLLALSTEILFANRAGKKYA